MKELVTIGKNDPALKGYLLGTFSKTHRAIPVTTLNTNAQFDAITFQLVKISEIKMPSWPVLIFHVFKLKNFIFVILPLFLIFTKNYVYQTITNPIQGGLAALGALLLHLSFNLRNDYWDHLNGVDQVHPQAAGRAIQSGWVTAHATLIWSNIYLLLGIACGIPSVFTSLEVLLITSVAFGLGLLGYQSFQKALKFRQFTEVLLFFLFGPLLAGGFQYSLTGQADSETWILGLLTGGLSVFILHLKNFEELMVNSKASFKNTISMIGFERAKTFLMIWWVGWATLLFLYQMFYSSTFWFWVMTAVNLFSCSFFVSNLQSLTSPVGSRMSKVIRDHRWSITFVLAMWIFENLFYLSQP